VRVELGRLLFGVVIVGSVPLLFLLTLPFLLASLGIGLLISVVSQTQTQAMQLAMFTLLPTLMLSGFVFARQGMPLFFQLVGDLLPMTYYLQILRGVILKGVGLSVLWPQFLTLSLFALATLGVSANRFRKRLD
jgi:ABC-2 type transport system permease protein